MNKELVSSLRELTAASMKDCVSALQEANDDLERAIDIIKTKGQNIVSSREGKVAAEGIIFIHGGRTKALVECNSETDFVARNSLFLDFAGYVAETILNKLAREQIFVVSDVEDKRKELVASMKENVVVRRWFVEQPFDNTCRVFSYTHNNNKLGVLLTLKAPSAEAALHPSFSVLGEELAMQVAAMSPLAASPDRLSPDVIERQKAIFEAQVASMNKPQAQKDRIIDGKLQAWFGEVCLIKQKSITSPKTTIEQLITNEYSHTLGGLPEIVNFVRVAVGEGIEAKKSDDFSLEVQKLSGVDATPCIVGKGVCLLDHTHKGTGYHQ